MLIAEENILTDTLKSLPREVAKDLAELFDLLEKADDPQLREDIVKTIQELLLPQLISVSKRKEFDFSNEDPVVRERLSSYRKSVGESLRNLRELAGMTQVQLADLAGLRAVLCGISERGWYTSCYCVQNGEAFIYMGLIGKQRKTVEEDLAGLDLGIMHDWARDSFRLAMGICLLGNDSEFIQPEVLTADQIKFGTSRDMKLVEKAKKRGKYGWTVGRDIECLPHIRRPHFAVRWTGKGGAVPKVVPVKGSVVKRKSMTDVPTGYMDDEVSSSS